MKPKNCCFLFLLLLFLSCNINHVYITSGYYTSGSSFDFIKFNKDNTFYYSSFNYKSFIGDSLKDSLVIGAVGEWKLRGKELVLDNHNTKKSDVNKFKIVSYANGSGNSQFLFKDLLGDTIGIRQVKNNGKVINAVIHTEGYAALKLRTKRIDTLTFDFDYFNSWKYVKEDTISRNYTIIVKPNYKSYLLQCQQVQLKHHRIILLDRDGKKRIFKHVVDSTFRRHDFYNGMQSAVAYSN